MFAMIVTASAVDPAWIPLRNLAGSQILVGTAVKSDMLAQNADYRKIVAQEYDLVTPENALKWGALRPSAQTFDFHEADAIVGFAETNHLLVRGHVLCWNSDKHMTRWMREGTFTPEEARALLKNHIETVAGRYRGKIFCWDVVNEAVENNSKKPLLNDGFWLRQLGPDYIALAFKYAHEADPQAKLFYNDYDLGEPMGQKSDRIFELVKSLKEKGVPINGVGLQSHYSVGKPPSVAALQSNIQRFAALGLEVHITELDVSLNDSSLPLSQRLQIQAQIYANVAQAALASPACKAIITWGFSDRWGIDHLTRAAEETGSELPQRLPFDENLKPKPAAFALANALRSVTSN